MSNENDRVIRIFGDTYEVNVIEISNADIERLIEARDSDNDFWDNIDDIRERVEDDSLISGFTTINGGNFTVELNNVDQPQIVEKFDQEFKNYAPYSIGWDSNNYLVYEKWGTGVYEFKLGDDFDESELELNLEDQVLPDENMRTVMTPNYADQEFIFVTGRVKKLALYVIKEDGERINL